MRQNFSKVSGGKKAVFYIPEILRILRKRCSCSGKSVLKFMEGYYEPNEIIILNKKQTFCISGKLDIFFKPKEKKILRNLKTVKFEGPFSGYQDEYKIVSRIIKARNARMIKYFADKGNILFLPTNTHKACLIHIDRAKKRMSFIV